MSSRCPGHAPVHCGVTLIQPRGQHVFSESGVLPGLFRASPLEGSTLGCLPKSPPDPASSSRARPIPGGHGHPVQPVPSPQTHLPLPPPASPRLPPSLHHQQLQNLRAGEHKRQVLVFSFILLRRKTMKETNPRKSSGGRNSALRSGEM